MNRLRLIPLVSLLVFSGCAALLPFVEPDQQGPGFSTDERRFSMQSAPRKLPTRQNVRRPDRLTTLIHNLKHGNDVTRTHAAYWLGELGAQATPAIPTLNGALLNDDSRWVRRASAKALGKIRSSIDRRVDLGVERSR